MIDMTHTVTIDRPVDEVFPFVAEPSNEPKWHFDVREGEVADVSGLSHRPRAPVSGVRPSLDRVLSFLEYFRANMGFR